jgi:hypothetical protein
MATVMQMYYNEVTHESVAIARTKLYMKHQLYFVLIMLYNFGTWTLLFWTKL